MTTAKKLLSTQTGGDKLYVDDVFSTYLYTGNGSTQTINNGIDLAGEGGLVWIKDRTTTNGHVLSDTARGGGGKYLQSNTTAVQNTDATIGVNTFNSSGFTTNKFYVNETGSNYASWTFRNAPKFFDVVTYTGNDIAGRQIPHGLGVAPGMIVVKAISGVDNWYIYHRSTGHTGGMYLNTTSAFMSAGAWWDNTIPTDAVFTIGSGANTNTNGIQYVAYLFAHDPSEDGFIQCGSFVIGGSFKATVNLGWEPQCLIIKNTTGSNNWSIFDTTRGITNTALGNANVGANDAEIYANGNQAEITNGNPISLSSTGFEIDVSNLSGNNLNSTFIYLAIRRPNKPPKTGTEVYNAIARTGTGSATTVTGVGFAPDLVIGQFRTLNSTTSGMQDRLRGAGKWLSQQNVNAEATASDSIIGFDVMGGYRVGTDATIGVFNNSTAGALIAWAFKRAPGFFDEVCYTGTGVVRTVPHGLGVAPELVIVKRRNSSGGWGVGYGDGTKILYLHLTNAAAPANNITGFNDSTFSVAGTSDQNMSDGTYVAYLFATLPGISKVGTYTGNGSSQTIDCGFTTGARFILVKSIDDAGDWFTWDTTRGIVAANDPHLSLNTTAVEVTTDDSVDPYSGGFIVNQVAATNINITGKRYIFLAIV